MTAPLEASTALDRERLLDALGLAEQAIGLSDPNPRVGCIIGWPDGRVLGRGFTQAAGQAHAEVMALRDAAAGGYDLRGATAWVTLEPCAHQGRTPPCCDALVEAGIGRVVAAIGDPNPRVNGGGFERLRTAGVEVAMGDAEVATAARELNIGFFSRMMRGRPWVRVKAAASLDGRTALPDGRSQWITGEVARRDGHAWRRRAGAVLTGIGTVLADDPRMDVRLVTTQVQPLRAVVDSHLRLPLRAKLLSRPGLVVYTALPLASGSVAALHERGAEVVQLAGEAWAVDLAAVVDDLARRGVNELHVEAGATLNGALAALGLVDEWLLYVAPIWMGEGLPVAKTAPPVSPSEAPRLILHEASMVGGDLRLRLRSPSREAAGCRWALQPEDRRDL